MNCEVCGDLGMLVQPWTDAEPDFAICLCPAADWYRSDENRGRKVAAHGWQVWCAVHQVDPARVFRLEDIYSAKELAAVGLSVRRANVSSEAALLAAGRGRKAKL
jgi:hypothetical protein